MSLQDTDGLSVEELRVVRKVQVFLAMLDMFACTGVRLLFPRPALRPALCVEHYTGFDLGYDAARGQYRARWNRDNQFEKRPVCIHTDAWEFEKL